MTCGNTPGPRGGSSRGGRGGSRGRGGGRGRSRGRGRYVGAGYAASLTAIRENPEGVLSDINNVSSSPASGGFNLRRDPPSYRAGSNWFGPVSGSVLLRYFKCSPDSPESYQFQTINSGEGNPDGIAFAIVHEDDQPLWKSHGIVYTNSRHYLLPGYDEKKAALVAQHQEATEEEKVHRSINATTENIKFRRYGLEDGPDMEIFGLYGNISRIVVPGEWQKKKHESPILVGCNNTPSVKHTPGLHSPIAVFETLPDDDRVQYISWFRIEEIELFAANSAALAKNLHQVGMDGGVDTEWATLKLSKILPGDAQYRCYPSWGKTEKRQFKLGQEIEHLRAVEDKGSDEEGLVGEREINVAGQPVADEQALVSEETGAVVPAETKEEEEDLVELVRVLSKDERMQALVKQAEEVLTARGKERVVEDVVEEKEE
ncbi:Putative protein of unknown function [Podospora comata]|uniref:Uncharacterized protein n=1 Tax=Podospora comata TaxID=48703 RepID=A0ABY6S2K2_PODCO|nr:Putative protein of unknown function [Podospora comata]